MKTFKIISELPADPIQENVKNITAKLNRFGNWSIYVGRNVVKRMGSSEFDLDHYIKEHYPNAQVIKKR